MELTPLNLEILQMTADGCEVEEIAAKVNRSRGTIKNHRARIMELLGADNIAQAIAMGFRRKLIE